MEMVRQRTVSLLTSASNDGRLTTIVNDVVSHRGNVEPDRIPSHDADCPVSFTRLAETESRNNVKKKRTAVANRMRSDQQLKGNDERYNRRVEPAPAKSQTEVEGMNIVVQGPSSQIISGEIDLLTIVEVIGAAEEDNLTIHSRECFSKAWRNDLRSGQMFPSHRESKPVFVIGVRTEKHAQMGYASLNVWVNVFGGRLYIGRSMQRHVNGAA